MMSSYTGAMGQTEVPTLFVWAGGEPAFERLIDAFYDRVEGDDLLSPLFPGGVTLAGCGCA
jgi:hemoglobin